MKPREKPKESELVHYKKTQECDSEVEEKPTGTPERAINTADTHLLQCFGLQ